MGDFKLWNELQARGHEIMPHGFNHTNKANVPLEEAQKLIGDCLDIFKSELNGFDPLNSVFNFPYNASTPELEDWLPSVVRAFRIGGGEINPLPHKGMKKRFKVTSSGKIKYRKAFRGHRLIHKGGIRTRQLCHDGMIGGPDALNVHERLRPSL